MKRIFPILLLAALVFSTAGHAGQDFKGKINGNAVPAGTAAGSIWVAQTANTMTALTSTSGTKYPVNAAGTWSLVTGTTPAAHALIDTTGHTASGLTIGNFLKATGATTYGFAAHGLTYSDVGAEVSGATATHAALTTGIHGLAITAGQTLTVTSGGTLGSAAYTASSAYLAAAGTAADSDKLDGQHGSYYLNGLATDTLWDAAGDLVQGSGANTAAKLTKGAEGTLLRAGAASNAYTTLTMPTTIAAGSIFGANSANVLAAINSTSGTKYLKNAAGTISWATASGGLTSVFDAEDYAGSDTEKIQAAIDAAEAVNGAVYIAPRTWSVGAGDGGSLPFTITAGIKIFGAGPKSYIHSLDGTNHIFSIAADDAVYIEDLSAVYAAAVGSPDAGKACIYVTDTNGDLSNTHSRFSRLTLVNGYYGIHFYRAAYWTVSNSAIQTSYYAGIKIENVYNNDEGDSTIEGSVFGARATATAEIYQTSSGGLRVINNKLLSYADYGIWLDRTGDANTSILLIEGNSIEHQDYAINLTRSGGARTFTSVDIIGNQIVATAIGIRQTSASWLDQLNIQGNFIAVETAGTYYGIALDGATDGVIEGNSIRMYGSSPVGLQISANSARLKIGINHFYGCTTDISNASATSFVTTLAGSITLNTKLHDIGALTPTDSNIIVGNGATWVAETGTTARTSLGLGTGDGPTFNHVHLSATSYITGALYMTSGFLAIDNNQFHNGRGKDTNYYSLIGINATGAIGDVIVGQSAPANLYIGPSMVGNIYLGSEAVLPNAHNLFGIDSGGSTARQLIGWGSDNVIYIGDASTSAYATKLNLGVASTEDNPIYIRVGGTDSRQITAGANGSGGAGYRLLRVPNI